MRLSGPLYIVSGPSGSGKTTILRALMDMPLEGLYLRMLKKVTTRALKPSDNPEEIASVSPEEFAVVQRDAIIAFERHGHQYALLKPEEAGDKEAYIQAVPAKIGSLIRESHPSLDVRTFRLFAEEQVIVDRLLGRNDALSEAETASRANTLKTVPQGVDYMVDASPAPEIVAANVKAIIEQQVRTDSVLLSDDEKLVVGELLSVCKAQGVKVCAYGGLAAIVYGAKREITDLDFLTNAADLKSIHDALPHLNVVATVKALHIGRIEIRKAPVRIGEPEAGQFWHFDDDAAQRLRPFTLQGLKVPFASPEDIVAMKAALQRGADRKKFDVEDTQQIFEANKGAIDKKYVIERARRSNMAERITSYIAHLGF